MFRFINQVLLSRPSRGWSTNDSDPRNHHDVLWHYEDLYKNGFKDELGKYDYESARKAGLNHFYDMYLPVTEEEIIKGKEVAYGLIEEDDWNEELCEFDFKKQTLHDPQPGTPDKIFVYKSWDCPDMVTARVRFKFSMGTYDLIESIYLNDEERPALQEAQNRARGLHTC